MACLHKQDNFCGESAVTSQSGTQCKEFPNYACLFKKAAENSGLDYQKLDPDCTYMFELCSPYNRIVVPYQDIKICHIGTRNNVTLQEIEADIGVEKPKNYKCGSLDEVIKMAENLGYKEEGYVVRDSAFRRVKVKSPAYISVSHLLGGVMGEERWLDLIRKNETEEVLTYFPEFKVHLDKLNEKLSAFETFTVHLLEEFEGTHFGTRKDLADAALKTKYPDLIFRYLDGKVKSPSEWLWSMPSDKISGNLRKLDS